MMLYLYKDIFLEKVREESFWQEVNGRNQNKSQEIKSVYNNHHPTYDSDSPCKTMTWI